jgi:hypothetical protein
MIGTYPDAYCLHNPDAENCAPDENGNCSEEFTRTANFTNLRFLPLLIEDAQDATRVMQIHIRTDVHQVRY